MMAGPDRAPTDRPQTGGAGERLVDLLEGLRQAVPGCGLAAYIDLDAELVLSASGTKKPRQETLDGLARTAASLLPGSPDPQPHPWHDQARPEEAIFWTRDHTLVLVRRMAAPFEALCCQCGRDTDIGPVLAGAFQALDRIGGAE